MFLRVPLYAMLEVRAITLKKSVLGEKGPVYTDLLEIKSASQ